MQKNILYITMFSLLFPSIAFAETVTTNTNNVPLQIERNNSRLLLLIPNSTAITKNSASGEWYNITYEGNSGWINRIYTTEGLAAKKSEDAQKAEEAKNNTSGSYSGDIQNLSKTEKMQRIVAAANKYGKQYDLDPLLILALIKVESSFNPNSCSYVNCRGLMQISYKYAPSWGVDRSRLYEIEYNIQHGTRLLRTNFIKAMGSIYDGLRAYNQGIAGAKKSSTNGKKYANKIMKYYNSYKQNGFTY